jgi:hypothetical protein
MTQNRIPITSVTISVGSAAIIQSAILPLPAREGLFRQSSFDAIRDGLPLAVISEIRTPPVDPFGNFPQQPHRRISAGLGVCQYKASRLPFRIHPSAHGAPKHVVLLGYLSAQRLDGGSLLGYLALHFF